MGAIDLQTPKLRFWSVKMIRRDYRAFLKYKEQVVEAVWSQKISKRRLGKLFHRRCVIDPVERTVYKDYSGGSWWVNSTGA